jgi:hypothetical protein
MQQHNPSGNPTTDCRATLGQQMITEFALRPIVITKSQTAVSIIVDVLNDYIRIQRFE